MAFPEASTRLIINADDYGYFPCVSEGILAAARAGAISATGIIANVPNLENRLDALASVENIDAGVHLNLTLGKPLTSNLAKKLNHWNSRFPSANSLVKLLWSGIISIQDIQLEWQAQIQACQGKKLHFLNSHEHVHMLPGLYELALQLAEDNRIPYVRSTQSEWLPPLSMDALKRNLLIQGMSAFNHLKHKHPYVLPFLGLNPSGKLTLEYFRQRLQSLEPGNVYELMCHPGRFDPEQITDQRLISYHDWEGELKLLSSPELRLLFRRHNILLTYYHELHN